MFLGAHNGLYVQPNEEYYCLLGINQGKYVLKNKNIGDVYTNSNNDIIDLDTCKEQFTEILKKSTYVKPSQEEIAQNNKDVLG